MGGDPATETLHQENISEGASSSRTQNLTSGYILPVSHNCNSVGRAEKVVKRVPQDFMDGLPVVGGIGLVKW